MTVPLDQAEDSLLVGRALGGDRPALEALLRRHQPWIYNVALRMVTSPADAQDVTQEVLIKIALRLASFRGDSSLRTWIRRIAVNHMISMRRRALEQAVTNFSAYGEALDAIPNADPLTAGMRAEELPILVEEAKLGCMIGMLLCLDRDQRMAYVLGEILGASSEDAAALLEIAPEAFRQRLSRARRDLHGFMNDKCGLLNAANPCRCPKKTKGFIDAGWVDPKTIKFADSRLARVRQIAENDRVCDELDDYVELFRDHPWYDGIDPRDALRAVMERPETREAFEL